MREIWRVRDRQAGLFTSIHNLKPWSSLDGTNKTFIHETLQKAYDKALEVKAASDPTPTAGGKIAFKNKDGNSSTAMGPGSGSPGPSRAPTSTLISETAFLNTIPRKSQFPMSARKLEKKGVSITKEVSSSVVEKPKGKTGPEHDVAESKRGSGRMKSKERREEK